MSNAVRGNCALSHAQRAILTKPGSSYNLGSFVVAIPHNLTERQTSSCCGYIVTNRNNAYFRYRHVIDFASLNSVADVQTPLTIFKLAGSPMGT
jgi:hypothetical protein